MHDVEHTLARLAQTFTVQDIMVKLDDLVCATDVESAIRSLEENPTFDVIPIRRGDTLIQYLERGSKKSKYIGYKNIVSNSTSILEVVDFLINRKYYFILSGQTLSGYLHFSDLNNSIVKIPFLLSWNTSRAF